MPMRQCGGRAGCCCATAAPLTRLVAARLRVLLGSARLASARLRLRHGTGSGMWLTGSARLAARLGLWLGSARLGSRLGSARLAARLAACGALGSRLRLRLGSVRGSARHTSLARVELENVLDVDRVGQRLHTELVHDELARQWHINLRARKSKQSMHTGEDEQGMQAAKAIRACRWK